MTEQNTDHVVRSILTVELSGRFCYRHLYYARKEELKTGLRAIHSGIRLLRI